MEVFFISKIRSRIFFDTWTSLISLYVDRRNGKKKKMNRRWNETRRNESESLFKGRDRYESVQYCYTPCL